MAYELIIMRNTLKKFENTGYQTGQLEKRYFFQCNKMFLWSTSGAACRKTKSILPSRANYKNIIGKVKMVTGFSENWQGRPSLHRFGSDVTDCIK